MIGSSFARNKLDERHERLQQTGVAIDAGHDRLGPRRNGNTRADQSYQVRGPHAGGEALATDIAKREHHAVALFLNRKKIAGQVTNSKNLARDFKVSETHVAGRAKPPVHLRRLENFGVQRGVILLQVGKPDFQFITTWLCRDVARVTTACEDRL